MAPGGVELRPRRSLEVGGSPELQNGGLRALEEAWMTTFRLQALSEGDRETKGEGEVGLLPPRGRQHPEAARRT